MIIGEGPDLTSTAELNVVENTGCAVRVSAGYGLAGEVDFLAGLTLGADELGSVMIKREPAIDRRHLLFLLRHGTVSSLDFVLEARLVKHVLVMWSTAWMTLDLLH